MRPGQRLPDPLVFRERHTETKLVQTEVLEVLVDALDLLGYASEPADHDLDNPLDNPSGGHVPASASGRPRVVDVEPLETKVSDGPAAEARTLHRSLVGERVKKTKKEADILYQRILVRFEGYWGGGTIIATATITTTRQFITVSTTAAPPLIPQNTAPLSSSLPSPPLAPPRLASLRLASPRPASPRLASPRSPGGYFGEHELDDARREQARHL